MAVASPRIWLTAEEFLTASPDQRYLELIEGEIVVNQPRFGHVALASELARLIGNWCAEQRGRGVAGTSADFRLDEYNVYAPDVWWLREERSPSPETQQFPGPPDLAVEVRSPSTWRFDVGKKKRVYESGGLPELWLVDTPAHVVLVYRRSTPEAATFDVELELARGETLTSPQLAGLAIDLDALFDR